MSRRNKVSYVENEEPAFIKRFKERVGYKEGPNVDTKREMNDYDDDNSDEDDNNGGKKDEKPTVVVLKQGDLTSEEAEQLQANIPEPAHNIGDKIVFKKPSKRKVDLEECEETREQKKDKQSKKVKSKDKEVKQKSTNLLSFNEDDDEEVD